MDSGHGLALGGRGSGSGGEIARSIGGGGASAAAWIRLVSSGVEDELVGAGGGGGTVAGGRAYGHYLEACFLCRKLLASNRDIYMYRGDIPFCSDDCRREQIETDEGREQIEMDEEVERKEKNTTSKKVAPRAPSPRDVESPPTPPKARAGSILAG